MSDPLDVRGSMSDKKPAKCRYCGEELDAIEARYGRVCSTAKITELKALVGTVRDITGCEVRNIDDIGVEQHSREIGARIAKLEAENAALAALVDDARCPACAATGKYVPDRREDACEWCDNRTAALRAAGKKRENA